jgi:DNA-binding transcriptional LysR family regulator
MLDPDLLRTFVKIAESRSFSAAAVDVGRTLSAVSMQMKRLEEAAGRRLLVRGGAQGTTLTPAGEVLLLHARSILDAHEAAFDSLMNDRVARLLSVGLPEAYLNGVLAPVVPELLSRFPDTSLRIRAEPSVVCARQVEEGTLDLALVTEAQVEDSRGDLVHLERCVWAAKAGSDVATRVPVPLVFPVEGALHRMMAEGLRRAGKPYVIVMTVNNDPAMEAAVMSGAAIGLLPASKLGAQTRELPEEDGFPLVPDLQVRLRLGKRIPPAGEWLAQELVDRFARCTA